MMYNIDVPQQYMDKLHEHFMNQPQMNEIQNQQPIDMQPNGVDIPEDILKKERDLMWKINNGKLKKIEKDVTVLKQHFSKYRALHYYNYLFGILYKIPEIPYHRYLDDINDIFKIVVEQSLPLDQFIVVKQICEIVYKLVGFKDGHKYTIWYSIYDFIREKISEKTVDGFMQFLHDIKISPAMKALYYDNYIRMLYDNDIKFNDDNTYYYFFKIIRELPPTENYQEIFMHYFSKLINDDFRYINTVLIGEALETMRILRVTMTPLIYNNLEKILCNKQISVPAWNEIVKVSSKFLAEFPYIPIQMNYDETEHEKVLSRYELFNKAQEIFADGINFPQLRSFLDGANSTLKKYFVMYFLSKHFRHRGIKSVNNEDREYLLHLFEKFRQSGFDREFMKRNSVHFEMEYYNNIAICYYFLKDYTQLSYVLIKMKGNGLVNGVYYHLLVKWCTVDLWKHKDQNSPINFDGIIKIIDKFFQENHKKGKAFNVGLFKQILSFIRIFKYDNETFQFVDRWVQYYLTSDHISKRRDPNVIHRIILAYAAHGQRFTWYKYNQLLFDQ